MRARRLPAPDARAWRLERVREREHHTLAPEKMDSTVYTAPALRPVDLAAFEAENWKQALRDRS